MVQQWHKKKNSLHLASVFHTFKGRFKLRMTTWQKLRGQFLSYNQSKGKSRNCCQHLRHSSCSDMTHEKGQLCLEVPQKQPDGAHRTGPTKGIHNLDYKFTSIT